MNVPRPSEKKRDVVCVLTLKRHPAISDAQLRALYGDDDDARRARPRVARTRAAGA